MLPVVLVVLLMAAAVSACGDDAGKSGTASPTTGASQSRVIFMGPAGAGTGGTLTVEVARTGQEKARGLMERNELGPDQGMIFIWDKPTTGSFWMKNTYIPLSIAFISAQGVIVDIQDMQPISEELHVPAAPYVWAVEANQGWFAAHGIKVGYQAEFREG